MTRTPRLAAVAAACVFALGAGAWLMLRTGTVETTETAAGAARTSPGEGLRPTPAPAPAPAKKVLRRRAAEAATEDAPDEDTEAVGSPLPRGAPGHVTGHVTLRATGDPAVGANVVVTDVDGRSHESTTDAAGVARFEEALPSASADFVVKLSGYIARHGSVNVEPGGESTFEVVLERATYAVGVVLEEDGRPLPGARVKVPEFDRGTAARER